MTTYTYRTAPRASSPTLVRTPCKAGEVVRIEPADPESAEPHLQIVQVDPGRHLQRGKGKRISYRMVDSLARAREDKEVPFSLKAAGINFREVFDFYARRCPKRGGSLAESLRRCRAFVKRTEATQYQIMNMINEYASTTDPEFTCAFEFWWTKKADALLLEVQGWPDPDEVLAEEIRADINGREQALENYPDDVNTKRLEKEIKRLQAELAELVGRAR